jgi:uncharacterized protein
VKWIASCLALAALLTGCGPQATGKDTNQAPAAAVPSHASKPAAAEPVYHLDHAQPRLRTVKLWLGALEVEAELCRTLTQIATGLMYRTNLGPADTMLFVFATPQPRSFYMKNVPFDIAAAYLDAEGAITEIVTLKAHEETPVPSKSAQVQYVLEAAPDFFTRHGLGVGAVVKTDKGSLRDTLAPLATLP